MLLCVELVLGVNAADLQSTVNRRNVSARPASERYGKCKCHTSARFAVSRNRFLHATAIDDTPLNAALASVTPLLLTL